MEQALRNGQTGGIAIGVKKIWSQAYADDVVVLARTAVEIKTLIKRFYKYLTKKKLELNVNKSKIVKFKKGGGRETKSAWTWGDQEMEEVKEFKYVGYTFQRNNNPKAHIRNLTHEAMIAMKQIWSIGERKFKNNIKIKIMMFDSIVRSILMHGAEVFGWVEYPEMRNRRYTNHR